MAEIEPGGNASEEYSENEVQQTLVLPVNTDLSDPERLISTSSIKSECFQPEFSLVKSHDQWIPDTCDHHDNRRGKRSSYFTLLEQEILLKAYEEHGHVFRTKSNTAAASKERKAAWENIAARVNACNSSGEKRTWIQLKMKYKNLIQKARRKRAEARKISRGTLPPEAKDQALSPISQRPESEGVPGGNLSEPVPPEDTRAYIRDGIIYFVEPPALGAVGEFTVKEEEEEEDETQFAATERETETQTENTADQHQGGSCPASAAQLHTLPVKEVYKQHLIKTIEKTNMEIQYLDRKIKKADLEILLLERQLRE